MHNNITMNLQQKKHFQFIPPKHFFEMASPHILYTQVQWLVYICICVCRVRSLIYYIQWNLSKTTTLGVSSVFIANCTIMSFRKHVRCVFIKECPNCYTSLSSCQYVIHVHSCNHTHAHTQHTHTHMHTCTHALTHMHTCTHAHTHTHVLFLSSQYIHSTL